MSKRNPLSHAVSVALSVNRTIFLRLHGADGEVIAHAPLRAIEALRVASELPVTWRMRAKTSSSMESPPLTSQ